MHHSVVFFNAQDKGRLRENGWYHRVAVSFSGIQTGRVGQAEATDS